MTRVKICGITRVEDALLAVQLGATAIGLNFYPKSSRYVTPAQAHKIAIALPPFITRVGVFVDATPKEIAAILQQVPLDLLQFHGDEDAVSCAAFGKAYIKVIRMRSEVDLVALSKKYATACGLLFDSYKTGQVGGTGTTFDWQLIPQYLDKPIILAGGLNPANVGLAIQQVKPYAVDVTSGVETSAGIKDPQKLAAFMDAVHKADR